MQSPPLVRTIDPALPIAASLRKALDDAIAGRRFILDHLVGFAVLALLLAAVGSMPSLHMWCDHGDTNWPSEWLSEPEVLTSSGLRCEREWLSSSSIRRCCTIHCADAATPRVPVRSQSVGLEHDVVSRHR